MSAHEQSTPAELHPTDVLLCRVGTGDAASFGVLYAVTSARIYGLVRKVLVDARQSDEVTQNVFLQIWRRAPRYDPTAESATAWMLRIAHQSAVDRSHASRVDGEVAPRVGTRQDLDNYERQNIDIAIELEHERVHRALRRLTVRQRRALSMAYWDALTIAEIAREFGITVDAAAASLRDALRKLRLLLDLDSD